MRMFLSTWGGLQAPSWSITPRLRVVRGRLPHSGGSLVSHFILHMASL